MQLNEADLIEIDRVLSRESLSEFVRAAWHVLEPANPYVHGWHIDCMCEHLEAVTKNQINRLLINVPPGMMKSLLTSVFWPAWEWGPAGLPSHRIVGASYAADLAKRDCRKMKKLVTSEWYQERWPIALEEDQKEKINFENTHTGSRVATPVSSTTGKRGDRVIWDDPHNVEQQFSQAAMTEATRIFRETLTSRVNNRDKSAIIVIMQRLSTSDVSQYIIDNEPDYEHVMLPMEYDPRRKFSTSIGTDPRSEEGEMLFPERFPRDTYEKDRRTMGEGAAGQLDQNPVARGGNIIKEEYLLGPAYESRAIPKILWRGIFGDTAQKQKEHNDYSVLQEWGLGTDNKIYLLDMVRGKWDAPTLRAKAVAFWQAAKSRNVDKLGTLRAMFIEDKSSGTGLIQDIRKEARFPVEGIERNIDKYARLMDVLYYFKEGFVRLPIDKPFTSGVVEELKEFSADGTHKHDDQLDPCIDAIKKMIAGEEDLSIWAKL